MPQRPAGLESGFVAELIAMRLNRGDDFGKAGSTATSPSAHNALARLSACLAITCASCAAILA